MGRCLHFARTLARSRSSRDIARSGPPADASPVSWTGVGPSLVIAYERSTTSRTHRFNVDIASAASFEYAGPVRQIEASSNDGVLRIEGRYEYRRSLLRDRFVRGLASCNHVLGPSRVDANWHVVESKHFSLHARPGTFADQSAATLGGSSTISTKSRSACWMGTSPAASVAFSTTMRTTRTSRGSTAARRFRTRP